MDLSQSVAPTAAVLSGIDLLMNPKKRAGSETSSLRSSGSLGAPPPQRSVATAPDATVRMSSYSDDAYAPPPPPTHRPAASPETRAFFYKKPAQPAAPASVYSKSSSSAYGDEEGDDDDDDDDDDEDDDDDSGSGSGSESGDDDGMVVRPRMLTPEEEANQKRDILYQFDRIERKGVRLPRRYTMADPLEEMKAELERVKIDRELDISVRFQRKMLMTCVTGIEMLNGKFDPFDVRLDGWSDSMHEQVNDYDEVFEELHMKYRGKAKMAPELKLMFMVGGSGVMFHLTNSMFRQSSMPGLEQVMRQNPALMRQMAQATMAAMGDQQQQQQQQAPARSNGGGLFSSLFGGLMGGGGASRAPPQQQQQTQQQPQQPQQQPTMRGPKHVDDILRDLHRDAFSPSSVSHARQSDHASRIEIISNASDSELSELPDDAASVLGGVALDPPPSTAAARGRRAPRRRGAS
jgi:hypothetical protein